jgi:hypothetical protein
VRIRNIEEEDEEDEPSVEEVPSVEEESVGDGGTEVPGVTVLVKKPMSEVEVSAAVLRDNKR